jgi:hypothetical protein
MSITEQIVTNKNGKAVAVQIPMNQYKKLLELVEEMEDIKAFDKAIKRKHKFIPFAQALKEMKTKRKK